MDARVACSHPASYRRNGPRVPLRYGTAPSEVCRKCGAWRTVLHVPGDWHEDQTIDEYKKEIENELG